MKNIKYLVILGLIFIFVLIVSSENIFNNDSIYSTKEKVNNMNTYIPNHSVIKSINDFSVNLMLELCESDDSSNMLSSPLSIYITLSILSELTDNNTKLEITKALNLSDEDLAGKEIKNILNLLKNDNIKASKFIMV